MIVCAAIKFYIEVTNREVILCGVRHGDCFTQLEALGFRPKGGYKEVCQGFVDNRGTFFGRKQALEVATEIGQISPTTREYKKRCGEDELYSEDLW